MSERGPFAAAGGKERQRKSREIRVGLINLERTLKSHCDNRRRKRNTLGLGEFFRLILTGDISYYSYSSLFWFHSLSLLVFSFDFIFKKLLQSSESARVCVCVSGSENRW